VKLLISSPTITKKKKKINEIERHKQMLENSIRIQINTELKMEDNAGYEKGI
jgi:hypothetical protein